jgi:hypothetical protein
VLVLAALLAGIFVLGHIVRYVNAALYFNVRQTWGPITRAFHDVGPDSTWRQQGRYSIEGLYAGASVPTRSGTPSRCRPGSRRVIGHDVAAAGAGVQAAWR